MKKLVLLAAGAALLAGPAFAAPSASNDITINGTAPQVCTLGNPNTTGSATNATFAGTTVSVTALASATDASLNQTSVTLRYAGLCNYAHNVGLKSANGGLVNASGAANAPVAGSGTFIQRVGYTATANWAGANDVLATSNSTTSYVAPGVVKANWSVAGANQGNLDVNVAIASSSTPVVAGTYGDTLTVGIGAAL